MAEAYESLKEKFKSQRALIGVMGLGYAGLPLARAFSKKGFPVLGFDINPNRVACLQRGQSYIGHIYNEHVCAMLDRGFKATDQLGRLCEPDAIVICVPTPLTEDREPDLTHVLGAVRAVAAKLRFGQLLVLESTTYPGTTREMIPLLQSSGLQVGKDFFLAYSPEREDPGNLAFSTGDIPKVMGAYDARSLDLADSLYGQVVVQIVRVSSLEVAEACKLLENIYRSVNVALVNELKTVFDAMGIDVWEVIGAAKTKPFGFQAFYPGPGIGGHCIPVDPTFLTWAARRCGVSAHLTELAGRVNAAMPNWVVEKIKSTLGEHGKTVRGSRVLILGMAYKKDMDDPREAPGFEVMDRLLTMGAEVQYNDPHIPRLPAVPHYPNLEMTSQLLTETLLSLQDCVVVITDHSAYEWKWVVLNSALVIDTRNATRSVECCRERIVLA